MALHVTTNYCRKFHHYIVEKMCGRCINLMETKDSLSKLRRPFRFHVIDFHTAKKKSGHILSLCGTHLQTPQEKRTLKQTETFIALTDVMLQKISSLHCEDICLADGSIFKITIYSLSSRLRRPLVFRS